MGDQDDGIEGWRTVVLVAATETAVAACSAAAAWLALRVCGSWHLAAIAAGYAAMVAATLAILWIMRRIHPFADGVYTGRTHPRAMAVWNTYMYLSLVNLGLLHNAGIVPVPWRKFVLRLLGADIRLGGTIISGGVCSPHLVSIGAGAVIGDGVQVSPHATVRTRRGMALVVKRIRIGEGAVIGAGCFVSPGASIAPGAMVDALTVVAMDRQVAAPAPAGAVRPG